MLAAGRWEGRQGGRISVTGTRGLEPADWAAMAGRFGLGSPRAVPSYVTRGAMGEIWRLETRRGRWAVKWQFPWAPAEARPADVSVQAAAAGAGIPLPPPVRTPSGDAVIAIGERRVRVYPWLDLGPAVPVPAAPGVAAEVGRLLGLLHRLALPAEGPVDPWYTTPPSPGDWDTLAERATAAGAPWAAGLAGARPVIAELAGFVRLEPAGTGVGGPGAAGPGVAGLASGRPVVVCHRDFTPDNVLPVRPSGRQTLGRETLGREAAAGFAVLDWEDAGAMEPGRELGSALLAWAGGRRFDRTAARCLLDGYGAAVGRAPTLELDAFGGTVAVQLNFLHVMGNQAIEDADHRGYAEQQIASLLAHGLDDLRASLAAAGRFLDLVS